MKTVVGVFTSRSAAEQGHQRLRAEGIATENISVLTPAASEKELAEVPTMATEQPGMGTAVGGVVGAAIGGSGGIFLGTAATVLLPGVGPVLVGGMIAAGLLGGAAAGAAAGGALEDAQTKGLPIDELFLYEDALRQGRTVVLALTEEGEPEDRVRSIFEQAGAESIDAARERWWLGLRDVEQEHYTAAGGDFRAAEIAYRRGFEAALHPAARGKSYEEAADFLRTCYPESWGTEAFRRGYERGQTYDRQQRKLHPKAA